MMRWMRTLTVLCCVGLLSAMGMGCGDDGPTGNDNNNTTTGDPFSEQIAVAQAPANAAMAAGIVQSGLGFAGGFGAPGPDRDEPVYNTATQQWEWSETQNYGGVETTFTYTVQFLANGTPRQDATGADTIHYTFTGLGSSSQSGYTYSYEFDYDITYSGLDTDTLLMDGDGSYTYAVDLQIEGVPNTSQDYVTNWHTVEPGVSIPKNGCPSGQIIFDMDPYTLTVTFDGSSTYQYTLTDGNGGAVDDGSGSQSMSCSP